jgi:hypothetical protein
MERLMSRFVWLPIFGLTGLMVMVSSASGQRRPYIGFAYPAGGRQGTTFQAKLGGQNLDGVDKVLVTGDGVSAEIVEYYRKIGPQEITLLREQLNDLKRAMAKTQPKGVAAVLTAKKDSGDAMMAAPAAGRQTSSPGKGAASAELVARIESRMREYCNRPACASLSSLVLLKITIAPDAEPGKRELRLATWQGVSNPLVFFVGQVPETARKPMRTADFQVLGKEELAQRKRPEEEVEVRVTVPCTMNGQIASGEENLYRFQARKGQRLVISAEARDLIPYLADAVPGWFQAVLTLYDANGKEVAYNDDYRFKPDPLILFDVPEDGEYVLHVTDAIYRGREDFVYRVTVGELPFVTSIFPLGARVGEQASVEMKGWNLDKAKPVLPPKDAGPGIYHVTANGGKLVSNAVPFALGTLPESFDKESNNDPSHAQEVNLPIVVNGRVDKQDDWDVFKVAGRGGETIVAEVYARRLDSPLDSMLKITDARGKVLAYNDDHEDPGTGLNTHHADSYVMFQLPADGDYYVHLGDTGRHGGEAYAYRLRISPPQPDFALRVVPSSAALRSRSTAALTVYSIRKDGFADPIKLSLKNPPQGFTAAAVTMSANQEVTRIMVKTDLTGTKEPVDLVVQGTAEIGDREVSHDAVPTEDMMQAFLWRHLVPAEDLQVLVYNSSYQPPPKRVRPASLPKPEIVKDPADKPKFTKSQVAGRLRQINALYQEYLITDEFNDKKVAECEAVAE